VGAPRLTAEDTTASVTERDLVLGVNVYFADEQLKAQVNYLYRSFDAAIRPAVHVSLLNLQAAW
jgi:hypothetical protein